MSAAKPRIAVLISGYGSNLQALIDASRSGDLPGDIVLVVSNRKNAYGLKRAAEACIPTEYRPLKPYTDASDDGGQPRERYDQDLAQLLLAHKPHLIVLAGWMHVLSATFLTHFPLGAVVNLHPALPGAFDGANAIGRAYEAFKQGKIDGTGVMVHKVIPEVDRGEPLLTRKVPILETDALEDLENRIHEVEHNLIVEGVKKALETITLATTTATTTTATTAL